MKLFMAILIVFGLMGLPLLQIDPEPGQSPPLNAKVYWVTETTAIITWIQMSEATEVFLYKAADGQYVALRGYPGRQYREFIINLPGLQGPNDARAFPKENDVYGLQECKRAVDDQVLWCKDYGYWKLGPPPIRLFFPLIRL